jgi:hypothetical protein
MVDDDDDKDSSSLDSPTIIVSLTDDAFQQSIERYLDENKPDPLLQVPQIRNWKFQWKPGDDASAYTTTTTTTIEESNSNTLEDHSNNNKKGSIFCPFRPSHVLTGQLEWHGEYCVVLLSSTCLWKGNRRDGSLFFRVHAQIRLITLETTKDDTTTDDHSQKEEKKKKKKTIDDDQKNATIRSKMLDRLRGDDYISKFLLQKEEENQEDCFIKNSSNELCQASICIHEQDHLLEERVHVNEDVAEAIRRAVFSTADAPLDVFDIVCRFPFLPCQPDSTNNDDGDHASSTVTTLLANRAKLRLLEDAMYDACENEEDEQVIDQLSIQEATSKRQRK